MKRLNKEKKTKYFMKAGETSNQVAYDNRKILDQKTTSCQQNY